MVFGRNLHLMAPFKLIEAGFCVFFPVRIFFVFGARGQIWAR